MTASQFFNGFLCSVIAAVISEALSSVDTMSNALGKYVNEFQLLK